MLLSKLFKSGKLMLAIYIILIATLLYARDIIGISVNKNIFIALVILFSMSLKYENLLSLILFTLPLMCGLPGNYFLPVWCLIVVFYQIRNNTFNFSILAFWLAIVLWEIMIYCFYPFEIPTMNVLGYFSALLLTCVLISEYRTIDYSTPVICFCLGCCVLLGAIFLIYSSDPSMMYTDGGVRMGGDMYTDTMEMTLKTNSNNIGYLSSASIACLFTLFYYKKIDVILFMVMAGVSFYCGMFSISRTWAISVILTIVVYSIFQRENKKVGYTLLCVIAILGFYYLSKNPLLLDAFIGRFEGDNIETGGQRTVLFAQYNEFLLKHPWNLFWGTSAQLYKDVTGLYHSTHNSLQQIWMSYGIIGFVVIITVYLKALKHNYVKKEYMACMPMLMIVFFLQSIQVLNPHNGMYPIIAAFFIMKMIKVKKNSY